MTEIIKNGKTTIQVSDSNKERLDKIGVRGESYDDIVNRLLDLYEKKNSNK